MKIKFYILALFGGLTLASGAAEYLIECGNFPETKEMRCVEDERAHGGRFLNCTMENAATSEAFNLPETGEYYVWLRTLSFGGNFRKATIFFNDRAAATLGDEKITNGAPGNFTWARSQGKVRLEAGALAVKVLSVSPYTRVDAILLSTDATFKPQGVVTDVEELKVLQSGEEKQP